MNRMAYRNMVAAGVLGLAAAAAWAQKDDVETRAMRDEMRRSMQQLQIEGEQKPYFISYRIVDTERLEAQASFGALTAENQSRSRILNVTVRVGDYSFDNTGGGTASGPGALLAFAMAAIRGTVVLPVDDNYDELRRNIWLATDAAYKSAVEQYSAKKAAQAARGQDEKIASFSKQPARQESEILPPVAEKPSDADHLVREASAVFRDVPSVISTEVRFEVSNGTEHFLNSEGTSYVRQTPRVSFHVQATLQGPTGEFFSDSRNTYARSLSELPAEAALMDTTRQMAERLTARLKGHAAKRYNGPVLVEDEAAAQLFANSFGNLLTAHGRTAPNGIAALGALLLGMPLSTNSAGTGALLNKIGSRVLPDFLTVTDNPQLAQADGRVLLGSYKFDDEGVPSQETVLVKDGILKTLLNSRTPARGIPASTGSMRDSGVTPGTLIVDTTKAASDEELKAQLVNLVKSRGLDYGYIVRRLENMSAVEAVRVLPDGHEEPIRDARLTEINTATFKDILAVSKERTTLTESAGRDFVNYIVPAMLFEDMSLEHVPNESPKLPVVPSPIR